MTDESRASLQLTPAHSRAHGSHGAYSPRPQTKTLAKSRIRVACAGLELLGAAVYITYFLTAAAPAPCSKTFWVWALLPPAWFLLLIVVGLALGPPVGRARQLIAGLGTTVSTMALVGTGLMMLASVGQAAASSC